MQKTRKGTVMGVRVPRTVVGALIAATVLASVALIPAAHADTVLPPTKGRCAPTPTIFKSTPKIIRLSHGMVMRIWDKGTKDKSPRAIRVVVVTIPQHATVGFKAVSTPDLSTTQTTSTQVAKHKDTLVAINAGVFNLSTASTPEGPQIVDAQVWKATAAAQNSINIDANGKAIPGIVKLQSHWTTPAGAPSIGSVNWQSLTGGINVYTNLWGHRPHPRGSREVWVTGRITPDVASHETTMTGKVTRTITSGLGYRPPANTWVLTTTRANAALLRNFTVGRSISLTLGYRAQDRLNATLWHTVGALGRGGVYIWKGVNRATCTGRDENPRPRTFIGWKTTSTQSNATQTDALIMTVQGRWDGGSRWGGATVHQATDLMLQLGAGRAVGFDSGGSTTMLAQIPPGTGLVHIDRANPKDGQRKIINALTVVPLPAG
jgi:exopolysaccharide biosynthesis protein